MSTPARSPQPARQEPPQSLMVIGARESMPEWLATPLGKYLKDPGFEVLLPSVPVNAVLGYGHKVAVSVVVISANPDDKEVFQVGKRKLGKGKDAVEVPVFAYSKAGLEKMAEAAGIQVKTERADDRRDPDYCEIVAYAIMKGSNGQPIIRSARKAFHMRDVADEAWRNRVGRRDYAKTQNWSTGNVTDAQLQADHDAEMASFKKHLVARVETGAVLRAFRSLLAIKSGLPKEQIEKPKVLARVEFNPDASDPVVKRYLLEQGGKAALALFGPQGPHVGAVVVEDIGAGDDDDHLGGGPVDEEERSLDPAHRSNYPVAAPAPAPPPEPTQEELLRFIEEGCSILGLDIIQRNDLFTRHKGDLAEMKKDLDAQVTARDEGGAS